MMFISLDMSTKFIAYALWDDGELVEWGKVLPEGKDDNSVGSFSSILTEAFSGIKIDTVVYEAAFLGNNVMTVKQLSKVTGSMIGAFHTMGTRRFIAVPPITWQTGINVGRTPPAKMLELRNAHPDKTNSWLKNKDRENRKQLIVDYVNEKYKQDFSLKDNDITDAIALGDYAIKMHPELGE
jgi:hypothetical protein